MNIAVFVSGDLGFDTLLSININPSVIFTNKDSLKIIQHCQLNNIPFYLGNPRRIEAIDYFINFKIDIGFSLNYIFLIPKEIFQTVPRGVVNLHGSLLPLYRGRTPHVWAIINGENETGVTAHLIDEGCDTGPVILQRKISINQKDTGQCLLNKFKIIYPEIVHEVLDLAKKNQLPLRKQSEKGTFYGKRTPMDGQICWNQKTKTIYNWIRAQSFPYPGAFTYLNKKKIVIFIYLEND